MASGSVAVAALLAAGAAAADEAAVARGAYLAKAADCQACHTAEGGQAFAGGLALNTPFGTIYSVNITPDRETGLGAWTEADFARALREGRGRGGTYLYPAMPYDSYTKITDADVADLWAYMQSLAPVRSPARQNGLGFPFDIREGLAVWDGLFFRPGRFEPDPQRDATWNRGAYLVEALGHCADCHTPRNLAGATEPGRALTGAAIDTWYAPDIADDPMSGIAGWSVDELATFLRTGTNDRNVAAVGPMAEVIHDSLSGLTDADIRAMAVYLKDARPPQDPPAAPARAAIAPAILAAGGALFEQHCLSCHKADGQGVEKIAPALAGNSAVAARAPDNVVSAVLEGFPARDSWSSMPSFATVLDDAAISAVTNYVRTAWGNGAQPNATPWLVGALRKDAGEPAAGSAPTAVFFCPKIARHQLDAASVAALRQLDGADLDRAGLAAIVAGYQAANPGVGTSDLMGAFLAGYCPVVDAGGGSYAEKGARLANFMGQVADIVAPGRG
ncbi:MAG: cytochrome c [Geminicoccaceae bacterium]